MHEFGVMAARANSSVAASGSSNDDSRCLLLALSHDELGVIFDGLADPLQPVVAVALICVSSSSSNVMSGSR